jgi:hypothetical protein
VHKSSAPAPPLRSGRTRGIFASALDETSHMAHSAKYLPLTGRSILAPCVNAVAEHIGSSAVPISMMAGIFPGLPMLSRRIPFAIELTIIMESSSRFRTREVRYVHDDCSTRDYVAPTISCDCQKRYQRKRSRLAGKRSAHGVLLMPLANRSNVGGCNPQKTVQPRHARSPRATIVFGGRALALAAGRRCDSGAFDRSGSDLEDGC